MEQIEKEIFWALLSLIAVAKAIQELIVETVAEAHQATWSSKAGTLAVVAEAAWGSKAGTLAVEAEEVGETFQGMSKAHQAAWSSKAGTLTVEAEAAWSSKAGTLAAVVADFLAMAVVWKFRES